jgi:hypothetical protein
VTSQSIQGLQLINNQDGNWLIKDWFPFLWKQICKDLLTNRRQNTSGSVILEAPTAMTINIAVFKDMTPCSLVEISQNFRGTFLSNFSFTVQDLSVEFSLKFSDWMFSFISHDVRTSSTKMHYIFIHTPNVIILDETVNYEAPHYQSSHSHVLRFILGLNIRVPYIGSPCPAAVTGRPGWRRRLCDNADILKDNMRGKYHLFR